MKLLITERVTDEGSAFKNVTSTLAEAPLSTDAILKRWWKIGGKPGKIASSVMRPAQFNLDHFSSPRCVLRCEGGSVSLAEKEGRFYVILNESTMAYLLDDDDLQGLDLVKIIEFDAEAERTAYLVQRYPGAAVGNGDTR